MRTAWTSNELNIIRKRPQYAKWHLAVHKPRTVAVMAKAGATNTHPASTFLCNNTTSGNGSAIGYGMTIWFGEFPGGSELGKMRVRGLYDNSTSLLPIAEAGSGLINWGLALYGTVVDEEQPWIKHPVYNAAASQWRMDYAEPYVDQLQEYGPLAIMGPPIVGVLQDGKFAASFVGASSISLGEVGPAIVSQVWEFPDGQSVSSKIGTEADPLAMTFTAASPGGRYCYLTITDNNATSYTGKRLIFLFNDISEAARVNFASIEGGIPNGGYRTQINVTSASASESEFPPGTEVVIFEHGTSYNSVGSSVGGNYPFRDNIVFRGWLTDEVMRVNPFTTDVTFNATTINGVMDQAEAYDIFHDLANPPTGASHWVEAASLSLDRTAWDMMKNRSNIGRLVDFHPASGLAMSEWIEYQSLPRQSFWQQLSNNYKDRGFLGYVAADMQSNVWAFGDAQVTGLSATLPLNEIIKGDRRDTVQISRYHRDQNAQVKLYAVGSVTPYGGESPGTVQGYFGGRFEQQRGLLTDNQDTIITWAGNLRAKLNNPFGHVVMPMAGNMRLDPVPQSMVQMSLSPVDNSRRYNWSNKYFYPMSLRLDYDAQSHFVNSTVEMEMLVNGAGGSSITFPRLTELTLPPPTSPPTVPTPTTPNPQGGGFGTVYVMTSDTLGRTRDFSATSPAWTDISPSDANPFNDFILDSWNPTTTSYLISNSGVWKSTDMDATSPSFTQVLTNAAIVSALGASSVTDIHYIFTSINVENYVALFFKAVVGGNNGIYCARSTNGGATWSYSTVLSSASTLLFGGAVDYVPHLINGQIRIYVVVATQTNRYTPQMYRSDDSGATFLLAGTIWASGAGQFPLPSSCHAPYTNNQNGNMVYAGNSGNSGGHALFYSSDSGATWGQVVALASQEFHRRAIETYTQDEQSGFYWYYTGTAATTPKLYTTSNAFSSVTNRSLTGLSGDIYASGGFPFVNSQFYGVTSVGIYVSIDNGDNWSDKTGDWSGGLSQRCAIVPLWTE